MVFSHILFETTSVCFDKEISESAKFTIGDAELSPANLTFNVIVDTLSKLIGTVPQSVESEDVCIYGIARPVVLCIISYGNSGLIWKGFRFL